MKMRDNLNFVFFFFDKPKCLKTSNSPNVLSFKAKKKSKKSEKRKEKMIYSGEKKQTTVILELTT